MAVAAQWLGKHLVFKTLMPVQGVEQYKQQISRFTECLLGIFESQDVFEMMRQRTHGLMLFT
jgi:hypothetical protein